MTARNAARSASRGHAGCGRRSSDTDVEAVTAPSATDCTRDSATAKAQSESRVTAKARNPAKEAWLPVSRESAAPGTPSRESAERAQPGLKTRPYFANVMMCSLFPNMKNLGEAAATLSVPTPAVEPITCGYHRPPFMIFCGRVHSDGSSSRGANDT